MLTDAIEVNKNIEEIFARKKIAVYALCLNYAAQALARFRQRQSLNTFWENRTGLAKDTVFTGAYQENEIFVWYMAHTQQYGIYLELANNRQNEAIRPIINYYEPKFRRDLAKIFAD